MVKQVKECAPASAELGEPPVRSRAMRTNSQFRWKSAPNRRRTTLSAWVMSIVFVAIAAISFTIDQTVVSSLAAGGDLGELSNPAQLIRSWIDTASGFSDHAE
jgi:hypothetical protein